MRKMLALILVVGIIFTMCACAAKQKESETTSVADGAVEKDFHIRSGIQMTGISAAVYYADKEGMFTEKGLNNEIIMFSNGPAINEALGAGEVDVLTMGAFPAVNGCLAYGERIVAWLENDNYNLKLFARSDSDIVAAGKGNLDGAPEVYGTADTWKGKEILITSGVSNHFAAAAILGLFGLDETDVSLVSMDGPSATAAFMTGEADVLCVWDPLWAEVAASDEYVCVGALEDTEQSMYCYITASEEMCNEHPDELVAYLEALLESQTILAGDDDLYRSTMYTFMSEYSDVSEEVAATSADLRPQIDYAAHKEIFTPDDSGVSQMENVAYTVAEFMVANGTIEESDLEILRENKFVDPSFLMQAIENLEG